MTRKRQLKYYQLLWLKHDFPAGLAVFLVALPLCLGIALASGAPLYAGLLSGIIGGLVVSLISGSALGVSGPAAGLSTVVAATIISTGSYQAFLLAVIIAGALQLLLGIFKLGTIASYFPSAVIKGMLAAIGIILITKQIPVALGHTEPDFWRDGFIDLVSFKDIHGKPQDLAELFTLGAIITTLVCLLMLWITKQHFYARLKRIPAPLMIVLIGTLTAYLYTLLTKDSDNKFIQLVNIPQNIFAEMQFADFSAVTQMAVWKNGLVIGLLATLETLLCVEAIDKLDKHNRITPVNRELVAQGTGNLLCGLLGAIPMTAVIVRGAANVDAGGRTKLSAFTHGVFLLLSVLFLASVLNQIPYPALAVVLLATGYNLTKPSLYRSMWRLGMKQFLPFVITIVVILLTDLLIGVCIGMLISLYFIIRNNFKIEFKVQQRKQHETSVYDIQLHRNVTFLNKIKLRALLDEVPKYSIVRINGSESDFIDYDVLEIIAEFKSKAHDRHIQVELKDIPSVEIIAHH
ncbi:MAG: SulP family inorganic anion transporter [Chitinophagaceae bacterium]|nr:SulP family inorganic anion transporter [Chitinophagaceae bacterium]